MLADAIFKIDDALELFDKPRVVPARGVDLRVTKTKAQSLGNLQDTVWRRAAEGCANDVLVIALTEAFAALGF